MTNTTKINEILAIVFLSISSCLIGTILGREIGVSQTKQDAIKNGVAEYSLVTNNSTKVEFRFIKDNTK